jgi:glycogen operon protein
LPRTKGAAILAIMVEVWPGSAFPLGATPSAGGTGFAVASEIADAVALCLFDGKYSEVLWSGAARLRPAGARHAGRDA